MAHSPVFFTDFSERAIACPRFLTYFFRSFFMRSAISRIRLRIFSHPPPTFSRTSRRAQVVHRPFGPAKQVEYLPPPRFGDRIGKHPKSSVSVPWRHYIP
jgi:hypothetical protein